MRKGDQLAERLRATARPWELAVFIWIPAIALAYACWYEFHARAALQDFVIFRNAALDVLHGRTPFPAADVHAFAHFDKFVYPPATALFFAPLAALPLAVGQALMLLLGVVASLVALRLLGVVDWRCYGVVVMSAPAVNSFALGAITSFLLLAVAAAWRYRDHAASSGAITALAAASKVFLWPVGLWLLATRRLRATTLCVAVAVAVTVGGWAAIGFTGMRTYPRLLQLLSQAEQGTSYSPLALFGLSGRGATAASLALALLVVGCVGLAARGTDGDRRALAVAVLAALVATPILWLHYLLLLVVPIALYRPRLTPLWFLPLLLWLTPSTHSHGVTWHIALGLAVVGIVGLRTVGGEWTEPVAARLPRRRVRSQGVDAAVGANV